MAKEILKIDNLTKLYGDVVGVKNLTMSLNEGEIFGFIGPNGAGKSTTIRSIMNLINKNEGKVLIDGMEFNNDDIEIKKMIGYLPSEINLYEDLTVKQMLDYHETFYSNSVKDRRKELVKILNLDETKKVEDLSLGNSKKLGIILALMHSPKLLILDEPTSGLDPVMQQVFYEILLEEKQKGTTILYSTHILSEISKVCDRVGIIKEGTLLKVEEISELKDKKLLYITIESEDIQKIIKDLKLKEVEINNNAIKFKNSGSIDEIIKKISKYTINRLLVEEATLEDVFLHYYK